MENEINNLNEELDRMKSLFTEERLYGNLVISKSINESELIKEGFFDFIKKTFNNLKKKSIEILLYIKDLNYF